MSSEVHVYKQIPKERYEHDPGAMFGQQSYRIRIKDGKTYAERLEQGDMMLPLRISKEKYDVLLRYAILEARSLPQKRYGNMVVEITAPRFKWESKMGTGEPTRREQEGYRRMIDALVKEIGGLDAAR